MTDLLPFDPVPALAAELQLPARGVAAVLELLDGGATVPFVARYRKEQTGGLDEVQIRAVQERRDALAELDQRRRTVLAAIAEQGKLDAGLRARILACTSRAELEDLYLPYRPKRRTRASIARERGLEPLARRILAQPPQGDPREDARRHVDPAQDVPDVDAALAGARDIVAELLAENAELRAFLRDAGLRHGVLRSKAKGAKSKDKDRAKAADKQAGGHDADDGRSRFDDYRDFAEPVARLPAHRYLAVCRGEAEGELKVTLELDEERALGHVLRLGGLQPRSPYAEQLRLAAADALDRLLLPATETAVRAELEDKAHRAAVEVFASNLQQLLLAAPLGARPVVGLDPGIRTGCKLAAVDAAGALRGHAAVFPVQDAARAGRELAELCRRHQPFAIAVGNGTWGREAEAFARATLRDAGLPDVLVVSVNEAGASVYSASDVARAELPDVDLTVRGAVSIARRLQDPLAELVKIEPKAIGVGQYQHDVDQKLLQRKLDEVVEHCVNRVGVDLNTASPSLLQHVAGIGPTVARNVVAHRAAHGPFRNRKALLQVTGLGPRTFEQAAGFLRIRGGDQALDASAVHPERYGLVERMARDLGVRVEALVGHADLAGRIDLGRYVGDGVGEPTLRDIVAELSRPGRDPRATFEPPRFRDDVRTLADLKPGMVLEGVVTNVTAFGAFVDVGVHQDGLVHVSQLADRFVRDPHEAAHVGQRLQVRVLEVDLPRKRIALSAKKDPGQAPGQASGRSAGQSSGRP